MVQRCIVLGDGKRIALGKYVAAWKACRSLPPDTHIGRGISGYGETAEEALDALRAGLHDRINRHVPGYGVGRKWRDDWFWLMWRTSRDLNTPRLAIHWLPVDLRARFQHRVSDDERSEFRAAR